MSDPRARLDAIDWRIRLRDGNAADWEAFTHWLEADPAHPAAYDAVALADGALEFEPDHAATPIALLAANDDPQAVVGRWRTRIARFTALAAAVFVGVLLYGQFAGAQRYQVATAAGEHRIITLGDGTCIALNGDTRMTFDRRDTRFAQIDAGEALFTVEHNTAMPFELVAGVHHIRDVGTVFNVVSAPDMLQVAVADGSVLFDPGGAAVHLGAGHVLDVRAGEPLRVSSTSATAVGSWHAGRLVYTDAPLSKIAADLSRALGVAVSVDDAVAGQRFTGVIQIELDTKALFKRLAALWDVDARHTAQGWRISAYNSAAD